MKFKVFGFFYETIVVLYAVGLSGIGALAKKSP